MNEDKDPISRIGRKARAYAQDIQASTPVCKTRSDSDQEVECLVTEALS